MVGSPDSSFTPRSLSLQLLAAAAACVICLFFVYHTQILSGGNLLAGDIIDARIAFALGEHWFNVFRGLEGWNRPIFFYPTKDTLGYNDGYLLYGICYSLFRVTGLDVFQSGEAAGAVFRVIGFGGVLVLGRLVLALPFQWALFAASLTTLSNALYLQSSHIQLLTTGLAPVLGTLAWVALRSKGPRFIALSVSGALLIVAWLLTAFYTVWFTCFFGAVAVCAAVALHPKSCWNAMRRFRLVELLPACVILLVGAWLFMSVYLPKAYETGMHSFDVAFGFTPSLLDLLHVGSGNLLFGWADLWITHWLRPGFPDLGEHTIGFDPALIAAALAGVILLVVRARKLATPNECWLLCFSIAAVVCGILAIHVGQHSLWSTIYGYVPGAGAVRVVSRFMLVLFIPVALLAAYALAHTARFRPRLAACVACLLLFGELNLGGYVRLDRLEELAFLSRVQSPPRVCRQFFVAEPRVLGGDFTSFSPINLGVDAMLIAETKHIPTLNGDASFMPSGFKLNFADAATYAANVREVVLNGGMENSVCGFHPASGGWALMPVQAAHATFGTWLSFSEGGEANGLAVRGWSIAQPPGRWTDGPDAELLASVDPTKADVLFTMEAVAFQGRDKPGVVTLFVNGEQVVMWRPVAGQQTLTAVIPSRLFSANRQLKFRIHIANPMRPIDAGLSADTRQLGLLVERVRLDASGP